MVLGVSGIFADCRRSMIEVGMSVNIRPAVNMTGCVTGCLEQWCLAVAAQRKVGKKVTDTEINGFIR